MPVGRNFSPVECHCIAHDGKSKSGSSGIPCPALGNTIESLEDSFDMFLTYSHSGVIIDKADVLSLLRLALYVKGDIVSGIFQTVFDKIPENCIDQNLVPVHSQIHGKHILHDITPG